MLVPLYVIGWSDIALFYYFENGHIAVDQVGTFLYIQFLLIGKVFNYENKKILNLQKYTFYLKEQASKI